MKYVASVSCGKDSVYMLHYILEHKELYPLDHVVFVNTGMEFQAVLDVWEQITRMLSLMGIPYTMVDMTEEFSYLMFEKGICRQGTKEVHRIGYGWCGGVCRWGTGLKMQALNRFYKRQFPGEEVCEYIGIAADEQERLERDIASNEYKVYPLVISGITEFMALEGCYKLGYTWQEDGVRLYEVLDRLSCFCCRNKNLKELKNIFFKLPSYWNKLKEMEERIGEPMKGPGMSLDDLERRFKKEGYAVSLFDVLDKEDMV